MTREEVIKIINDDPHLTTEQGKAIIERFRDCHSHFMEEATALVKEGKSDNDIASAMFKVCFMVGYVYASLELNGEVKAVTVAQENKIYESNN